MTAAEIKTWIAYWTAAKMVNFDAVRSVEQVYECRKYCSCMRVGVFTEVSDLSIWNALQDIRGA